MVDERESKAQVIRGTCRGDKAWCAGIFCLEIYVDGGGNRALGQSAKGQCLGNKAGGFSVFTTLVLCRDAGKDPLMFSS